MPWDGTELSLAEFGPHGTCGPWRRLLGGPAEALLQPEWLEATTLTAISESRAGGIFTAWVSKAAASPSRCGRSIKIWPAATNGDLKAAHVALKIIVERAKLLGLDRQAEDAREQQTIVISGTSDEYIAGLKAIIGAGDSDAS